MSQKTKSTPATKNGAAADRTAEGRFADGNKGGPGRPKRLEVQFWADVRSVVSRRRWRKAVEALLIAAEGGDLDAFKLLRDLVLGKPDARPSFVDLELARLDRRNLAAEKIESLRSHKALGEAMDNLGSMLNEQEAQQTKAPKLYGGSRR